MKNKNFSTFLILILSSAASIGAQQVRAQNTNIIPPTPCVGLDGVPIPAGALATQCCPNGTLEANAPSLCRTGFNTITGDTAAGAAFSVGLAGQILDVANNLNGSVTDLNQVAPPQVGAAKTIAAPVADVSAISSLGQLNNATDPGTATPTLPSANTGGNLGVSSGGGVGAGSAKSGLAGGLFDSVGKDSNSESKSGTANSAADAANAGSGSSPVAGKFIAVNENGSDARDQKYNYPGAGANGAAGDAKNASEEITLGESASIVGDNGQIEGTMSDPANYFSMTNKSDDLFQLISKRYQKKWKRLAQVQKN